MNVNTKRGERETPDNTKITTFIAIIGKLKYVANFF